MPLLSLITAVLPANSQWLQDTWASLRDQDPGYGWQWEWLVQSDGPEPMATILPADERIRIQANPSACGPAMARNLALARAGGELVKVLDGDDLLTAGELAREVELMARRPEVGWLTCRALDLLPDGRLIAPAWDPPDGCHSIGSLHRWFLEHERGLPVHPATLCVRADLLRALGGWMALPSSEDTGLMLALNSVAEGWHLAETGLHYRRWADQLTASPLMQEPSSHRAAMLALIEQRARALALWEVRWPLRSDSHRSL